MSRRTGYTRLQITLHWLIAVLIAAAWFTHEKMDETLRRKIEAGITGPGSRTAHTLLGVLTLVLVLWRIAMRLRTGAPERQGSPGIVAAAKWGHRLLYALMVAVPLGGLVAWTGGLREAGDIHGLAGQALVILAAGHAAAALWHHVRQKDGTLRRMIRPA